MRWCAHNNKYRIQTLSIRIGWLERAYARVSSRSFNALCIFFRSHSFTKCVDRALVYTVCVVNTYEQMNNQILNHVDGMEITQPRSPIDLAYTIFSSGFVWFGLVLLLSLIHYTECWLFRAEWTANYKRVQNWRFSVEIWRRSEANEVVDERSEVHLKFFIRSRDRRWSS